MPTWIKALFCVFLAYLIWVYWITIQASAVGLYHDDGIYVVTAKALAEGKGYRIISLPDPIAQTKYPFLFPLLLAGVWKIFPQFPENVLFLKLVPLLHTVLWCWLIYRFIKQNAKSIGVARSITALTLASPWVVFFSTTIVSETMFACLCTGALFSLRDLEQDPAETGVKKIVISSMLASASFLTRTAGLPLIVAGTLGLFLKRRYKVGLEFFLLCALFVAPWFWWQAVHHNPDAAADAYYSWSNYQSWNLLTNFTPAQKAIIFLKNILNLAVSPGDLLGLKRGPFVPFFAFTFAAFALYGFLRDMSRCVNSLHLFLLLYNGMLLVWAWPPMRFCVPVLPFLLFFAYKGFVLFCAQLLKVRSIPPRASWIPAFALIPILCYALYIGARRTAESGAASLAYSPPENWQACSSLLDWIREHTPPDAVLLGNLDPTFYLYTGRRAVRGFTADPFQLFYADKPEFPLGKISDLMRTVIERRVNYIVQTPSVRFQEGPFLNSLIDGMVGKYPEVFRLAKAASVPGYAVYEVDRSILARSLKEELNSKELSGATSSQ